MASEFLIGGLAASCATVFTNPIEVIKTRIQLQGELRARGTYVEPYKGIFHAFATVVRNDGWLGLQKGFVPAIWFQFIINSCRLSIYQTADKNKWLHNKKGEVSFPLALFWGALGGAVGAYASSPFFMVKTQLQSKAAKQISVGYQHEHTSMSQALRQVYKANGIRGLWRGSMSGTPRALIGSGAQIAMFAKTKYLLYEYELVTHRTLNSIVAGAVAGSFMSIAITPPDVIATRLYNQGVDKSGRGLTYHGWIDCLVKIFRSEGLYGFYKGFWPNYIRISPHSTLTLLFFDEIIAFRDRLTASTNALR